MSKKLDDTVYEMNKAVRWGRLGMATRMVEPGYQQRFAETHSHWGQSLQVADTDVVQLEMAEDSAVATVAYQWYQADAMTLHQTVVRQLWSLQDGNYGLSGEVVVQGDPRLFHPPPGTLSPGETGIQNGGQGVGQASLGIMTAD